MTTGGEESRSLEYTPTWVVAVVCSIIVLISLCAERLLHHLGKFLTHKRQYALFEALQKLKEELMLLGFISLLLTVFQGLISHMCIPENVSYSFLPCKREKGSGQEAHFTFPSLRFTWTRRHLLAEGSSQCGGGKVPLLSLEALHQLHIFIFVLAVVHVFFCATTMVLGGAKIRQWKHLENSMKKERKENVASAPLGADKIALDAPDTKAKMTPPTHHHRVFLSERTMGFGGKFAVVSWLMSFLKQFYGSVTASDYAALRAGFIMTHCSSNPEFDFHKYMMRTLETDFKKVVGISWYLWLFVVVFLFLNVDGWHTYFWLSFLPLLLLLAVGAKLEHIITQMAQEVAERQTGDGAQSVKLSDDRFWFSQPGLVLYLIHFILFQNSFEIAFFFWILSTYGFKSCIMEDVGYIIPRLIIGVIIQVLCSYSTLPLYALVTQMGDMFKKEIFDQQIHSTLHDWMSGVRGRGKKNERGSHSFVQGGPSTVIQMHDMVSGSLPGDHDEEQPIVLEGSTIINHWDRLVTNN